METKASDPGNLKELAARYDLEWLTAIPDDMLDASLIGELPVEWARTQLMLPVMRGGRRCVLLADPSATHAQKFLSLMLGAELLPVLAAPELILNSIERCYYRKTDTTRDFLRDMDEQTPAPSAAGPRSDDLLQTAENAPVTQLVNLILLEAVKAGASDIHVEPFETRLRVRYRIDGVLYEKAAPPKHMEAALISRLKVMARMDIAEKRLPQDGVARVRIGEREIDIRVSSIPVAEGERIVLRLLNRHSTLLPMSGLGMPAGVLARFDAILGESHGIIIVAGPTGSGKTTTLYAALQKLDAAGSNILTIEDPIEYQLPDIGQIQVNPKIGLTFSLGLRHILRQDPDTILVGEIRDLETAEIAVRASLTGHMVFATLHTNGAPDTVLRMIDMGIEPYLLASSLRAVLAQRLVRRLCDACKTQAPMTPRDLEQLRNAPPNLAGRPLWTARGCPACLDGYRGRLGLFELMILDEALAERIRSGQTNLPDLRSQAVKQGMKTLLEDGLEKAMDGVTSLDEVLHTVGRFERTPFSAG